MSKTISQIHDFIRTRAGLSVVDTSEAALAADDANDLEKPTRWLYLVTDGDVQFIPALAAADAPMRTMPLTAGWHPLGIRRLGSATTAVVWGAY